ncbi:MAG: AMP-binding protein [Actinomycetaceae bacterium]|nr:AMP-binding protein [Actinomycetaceae bacterium]
MRVNEVVSVPARVSVPAIIAARGIAHPNEPIVEIADYTPDGTVWRPLGAGEFVDRFLALAAHLAREGLAPGGRVIVWGTSGLTWNLIDLAIQAAGGVVVPIYDTASPSQARHIIAHSRAIRAFADSDEQARILADAGLTPIRFLDAEELLLHAPRAERTPPDLDGNELATIVYTSGTTGTPRAVPLTHRNLGGMLLQQHPFFPEAIHNADVRCLHFLPMAHIFARTAAYMPLAGLGVAAHVNPDHGSLVDHFQTFHPTTIGAVPRVLEKIEEAARSRATGPIAARVFAWAQHVARARAPHVRAGTAVPRWTALRYRLARRLVLDKITQTMGGNMRCIVSGGAPLDPKLDDFFTGMGIRVCNGYGMTETSGGFLCNTFTHARPGTAGRPLPGCEARIAEDGELQVRGLGVANCYLDPDDPDSFTPDGWLRTGDLASIDDDGYVTIRGRVGDLIVTASGKNVQPGPVEEAIRRHPGISQVMLVGESRPYVAALVAVDDASSRADEQTLTRVRDAIVEANEGVSRAESVRRFRIIDGDFTQDNGLLTPSLKIKRNRALEVLADDIEALYRADAAGVHDVVGPAGGARTA